MRIALLGAGHIGQTIAHLLATSGDYQVTLVDQNPDTLSRLPADAPAVRNALSAQASPGPKT